MAFLIRSRAASLWLVAAVLAVSAQARAQTSREIEVKAVFLYNFAKYVDWPETPAGNPATIRMCVPANPTFLSTLQAAVRDEVINGRPLSAIGPDDLDAAKECDIIYVGDTATPDAAAWIGAVRGRHTLIVGDGKLADGVVIAFVRDQDRVRFDISRANATKRGLSISSRLLGLARRVDEP